MNDPIGLGSRFPPKHFDAQFGDDIQNDEEQNDEEHGADDVDAQEQPNLDEDIHPELPVPMPPFVPLRWSTRDHHPFTRYSANEYVLLTDGGEPECYAEAMKDEHKKEWFDAMQDEMKSLYTPRPRYKCQMVVKGFSQKKGIDFDEIFSPVVKMGSIRVVLGLAASLDLERFGDDDFIILLLYVDDMLIVGKNIRRIAQLKQDLSKSFAMKDLGPAKQILGIRIFRDRGAKKLHISQEQYIEKNIEKMDRVPYASAVKPKNLNRAAKTSGTITGILYIDDRTAFVLFDTGATHSIISTTFAKKLNVTPTPLIERVIISTPMKNHMLIDHEYVNCPLRFDDRIRPANLLPIHMLDFDVILGMDWLASHRATIDCYARTVIFGNVRQPEFVYHGSSPLKFGKLISAMKARTLISHGCQGFLAFVMDTSLESPNIENLSVVREFADVFLDELPRLPPAREIEFGIELILGAEPISKAPYRMAPVELKELKEQLQEMLEMLY
ncbi:putative reverse transcriptase domain-containing protein [Tanacetum coccineum]